jgi:hypothetical protein
MDWAGPGEEPPAQSALNETIFSSVIVSPADITMTEEDEDNLPPPIDTAAGIAPC